MSNRFNFDCVLYITLCEEKEKSIEYYVDHQYFEVYSDKENIQ